jgi:hypothetical protein
MYKQLGCCVVIHEIKCINSSIHDASVSVVLRGTWMWMNCRPSTTKLIIFFHPRVVTTSKLTIFFHPRVVTTSKLTIFFHPLVVTTSGHHLV